MRIHFSAEKPCSLRLGGALVGSIGEAEKFADIGGEDILAEFLPDDGDLLPLAFRIGSAFFDKPPACAEVCRYDCGADVKVRFSPRDTSMRVLAQERFGDALLTIFSEGKTQLSLECGNAFGIFTLPAADDYRLGTQAVGGGRYFSAACSLKGKKTLCLFNESAEEVFRDTVSSFECGETLRVSLEFADIAGHTGVRTLRADGKNLREESYSVHAREGFSPDTLHEKLLPFALFQEIAVGGDPTPYLAPSLAEKKHLLKEYLGDFCGVYLPKEIFYIVHGQKNAAGLLYRRAENAYDVKFFAAETAGGKIINIAPVE